jgi:Photoprotection regulator fluorescence recovery protein
MRDLKWSPSERVVARRTFDQALNTELQDLVAEAKRMAGTMEDASELWELESWLTQRRLEIDRKYDYRYSVLPFVFANLLQQGRITEKDLQGLCTEKIELILGIASRL